MVNDRVIVLGGDRVATRVLSTARHRELLNRYVGP